MAVTFTIPPRRHFLPERIKEARVEAGLSQELLAVCLETRARDIYRWERGQHSPHIDVVVGVADLTGKPLDFFFTNGAEV